MSLNNHSTNNHSKDDLLDLITKVSFAMDDTRLYLDTHPDCPDGLDYFKKMAMVRQKLMNDYSEKYGSLTSYSINDCPEWSWNCNNPWSIAKKGGC